MRPTGAVGIGYSLSTARAPSGVASTINRGGHSQLCRTGGSLVTGLAAIWNPFGEPIEEAYGELDFVIRISDHNPLVFAIALPTRDLG